MCFGGLFSPKLVKYMCILKIDKECTPEPSILCAMYGEVWKAEYLYLMYKEKPLIPKVSVGSNLSLFHFSNS